MNSTFNDNGTITYTQRRYIEFIPELSVGDPKIDSIISPNIPLVVSETFFIFSFFNYKSFFFFVQGIAAALQDSSMFVNMAVSSVAHYLGSKPFVNLTIDEYLWGYDDPLVELANNVVPNWIDFPRFGILERVSAIKIGRLYFSRCIRAFEKTCSVLKIDRNTASHVNVLPTVQGLMFCTSQSR